MPLHTSLKNPFAEITKQGYTNYGENREQRTSKQP